MKKKQLVIFLTVSMLAASLPVCTYAEENKQATEQIASEEAESVDDESEESEASENEVDSSEVPDVSEEESETEEPVETPALAEGNIGENLAWSLSEDGVLSVSGQGSLCLEQYPWDEYRESVMEIVLDGQVEALGEGAFSGCTNLCKAELNEGLQSIGASCFENCSSLKGIIIPASIESVGERAFACSGLLSITFDGNAPLIADTAYEGVKDLRIIYPSGNETWSEEVLVEHGGRRSVWISSDLICGSCGQDTYWEFCNGTLTIQGSGDIDSYQIGIDEDDFELKYDYPWGDFCTAITTLVIGEGITSIGNMNFAQCENLHTVFLTEGLLSIGKNAFNGCTSLKSVVLPHSCSHLMEYAFSNCSGLESITFSEQMVRIDANVFKSCANLKEIFYSGDEESWNQITIDKNGNDTAISQSVIEYSFEYEMQLLDLTQADGSEGEKSGTETVEETITEEITESAETINGTTGP